MEGKTRTTGATKTRRENSVKYAKLVAAFLAGSEAVPFLPDPEVMGIPRKEATVLRAAVQAGYEQATA